MLLFSHGFNILYGQITAAREYRRDHGGAQRPGKLVGANTKRAAAFRA